MDTLKPPPLLVGATVLFWGWQVGLLLFAVPMAIALELVRYVRWRWAFSDKDFNRLTDLTNLLLIGVAIYAFLQHSLHGLFVLLSWMPMVLFVLVAVQIYSGAGTIRLSSLFWSLRRSQHPEASTRIDLTYPYLFVCIIAAAMDPQAGFYWGAALLIAWGLWDMRPRRYPAALWVALIVVALLMGYAMQGGLRRAQNAVEEWVVEWIGNWYLYRDPYRQHTAIGEIGELKFSDRIMLRVDAPDTLVKRGLLLRESSYEKYIGSTWYATNRDELEIESIDEGARYLLTREAPTGGEVSVDRKMRRGRGLIAVPSQTYVIEGLPETRVVRNANGTVKLIEGPGYASYTALVGVETPRDAPPTGGDRQIPEGARETFASVARQIAHPDTAPEVAIDRLERFFEDGFGYTLDLNDRPPPGSTTLEHFITESRRGHCELYATATVFLLRSMGVPARYAVGWSVQEYSPFEGRYVVRRRHAHAWALAYYDGHWHDVDTTPVAWVAAEAEITPWWQPLPDLISWLGHRFQLWRWSEKEETSNDWLVWLLIPLGLLLMWRLYGRQRIRDEAAADVMRQADGPGSPFHRIIERLVEGGYERAPGEPLGPWLARVNPPDPDGLARMLMVHNRLRFDPRGIERSEREGLEDSVSRWLRWFEARNRRTEPLSEE